MHGSAVVINLDLLPTFGVIEDIDVDRFYSYYFVLEILHPFVFPHYHAHEVSMIHCHYLN